MTGRSYRLDELAALIGGRVVGDPAREVRGVASLEQAGPDQLSLLTHPRYAARAARTRAGAVLTGPDVELPGKDLLVSDEPYLALARLLRRFHPPQRPAPGVSPDARLGADVVLGADVSIAPFAVIGDRVTLGEGVVVGAGSVIGDNSRIGDRTTLHPRVVLYPHTEVGARCIVHAGVVLGGDGFGFATSEGRHHKVLQLGRAVLEDDVEIGPNSTVDRGALEDTRVGAGTKIDDLVMVAHGVHIGRDALLVAQSGIAGSARIGERLTIAGQSGIAGHLRIGDDVVIAAKSAVFSDQPDGAFVSGVPAGDHRRWRRAQSAFRRLPELLRRVRALERKLERLEEE